MHPLCICMHPYASVCIHMHPSRIRMHPYASITHPNANIQHTFPQKKSKVNKVLKSQNSNCVLHRKIGPNPTQHSKPAKNR